VYDPFTATRTSVGAMGGASGRGRAGTVRALRKSGSSFYVGGDFTTAGGTPASGVARYTPGTGWAALGSGVAGSVAALAPSSSGLYAGGEFAVAGGKPSNALALWGSTATSADLALHHTAPATVPAASPVTFTTTIENRTRFSAPSRTLTVTLPSGVMYGAITPSQGTCTRAGTKVTCALGTVAAGATVTVKAVVTPVQAGALSSTATVSPGDGTPDNSATAWVQAVAVSGTVYVKSTDGGFSPAAPAGTPGTVVQFNFFGPGQHSARDASGMGLFDSGLKTPVAFHAFRYEAAGTWPVTDAGSAATASVGIRPTASASSVPRNTAVTVRLARVAPPPGYVLDLRVLRPGTTTPVAVATGTSSATVSYTPTTAGTYRFEARTRRTAGGASGWSPVLEVAAT
jgi:hypothetical protein